MQVCPAYVLVERQQPNTNIHWEKTEDDADKKVASIHASISRYRQKAAMKNRCSTR